MKKAISDMEFTISISTNLLRYFEGKQRNTIEQFCSCAIDRINQATISLKELFSNANKKNRLEYGCAIILRSILSDALLIINACLISANEEPQTPGDKKLEEFCSIAFSDSIEHLIRNVGETKALEKKEIAYNSIAQKYSQYLKPHKNDGSKPEMKTNKKHRNSELAKNIESDKTFEEYKDIYDAYLYYSKYEHFGIIYHDFQELGYEKQIDKIKKTIKKLLPKILSFIVAILFFEEKEEKYFEYCLNDLSKYMEHSEMEG